MTDRTMTGASAGGVDLCADAIFTGVNGQAELLIGLHSVLPIVLQIVSPKLVAEPDAPPFMAPEIHQDAPPGLLDQLHGQSQLIPTVAPGRAKDVPCEALRVHPHQDILPISDVSLSSSSSSSSSIKALSIQNPSGFKLKSLLILDFFIKKNAYFNHGNVFHPIQQGSVAVCLEIAPF